VVVGTKAMTTEGEITDVFTAAGSSAPTARDMPAQGNAPLALT